MPFNGAQVLLAVPCLIGGDFGGDGVMVDPDHPFTLHLARGNADQLNWITNATDEETGKGLSIDPTVSIYWAKIDMPY